MFSLNTNTHPLTKIKVSQVPGTGITDCCELSYGCWDIKLGPLKEPPMLATSEPSLQHTHGGLTSILPVFVMCIDFNTSL